MLAGSAVGACWIGAVIVAAAASSSLRGSFSTTRNTTTAEEMAASSSSWDRPALVQNALARNETLYYFGLGSNMLRSKLENRGVNSSAKIAIIDMQPAIVKGHRLAFNMRGFLPLEPGMGSLEPVNMVGDDSSETDDDYSSALSKPLHSFEKPECHGALVHLTADNYVRLMQSEGVNAPNSTQQQQPPGYEEVVVTAHPYDSKRPSVQAIALRARPHVRLSQDPCPSARYMAILKQGAAELQLHDTSQQFLQQHPVHQIPRWLKRMALYNFIWNLTLSNGLKWRGLSKFQNWLQWRFYVPTTRSGVRLWASHCTTAIILAPGALLGALYKGCLRVTKKELPPMIQRFTSLLMAEEDEKDNGKDNDTIQDVD